MKTNHLVILAIVLISLFGIVKGLEYLNRDEGRTVVENFIDIDTSTLDKIELTTSSGTTVLEKTNEGWELTSPLQYPANQTNVQTLLTKLEDFKTDSTISTNPENQSTFEVDDATGTRVTLYSSNEQLAQFYVGKSTTDYNHTYVRQAGSDEIKTARGSLKTTFGRSTLDWRDKTIYSYDAESLTAITISARDQESFTLSRNDQGIWQINGRTELDLDTNKVQTLINSASAVNCIGFVDEPTEVELDFAVPDLQITIVMGTTSLITNLIAPGEEYYAQLANHDQIFEVAQYVYENLDKQPADLTVSE